MGAVAPGLGFLTRQTENQETSAAYARMPPNPRLLRLKLKLLGHNEDAKLKVRQTGPMTSFRDGTRRRIAHLSRGAAHRAFYQPLT